MILAQTTTAMPWWFWVIIIVFTIVGLVLGLWGFLSGFKSTGKAKKSNHVIDQILDIKKYSWIQAEQVPEVAGIYVMFIGTKYDDKEFFIPIYINKSRNIKAAIMKLKTNIVKGQENTLGAEITSYLLEKHLTAVDVNFYIVEAAENELDDCLNKYLEATKASKRGFKN